MRVSELYAAGPLTGQDVFIVGTGSSMTVFPMDFLRGRRCVLLNDAQKWFPELGPVAFSNSRRFLSGCRLPYQIVKGRLKTDPHPDRTDNHVPWDSREYYVFSYRDEEWDNCSHFDWSRLWLEPDFYVNQKRGCSAIFALQFALQCKPKSVTLVGCDCCDIAGDEYLSSKPNPVKFCNRDYFAYANGGLMMMREARKMGIPVMSLNPFSGLGRHEKQYREMLTWK